MYKAIKDNKIIAISDTDSEFLCLVKDEVVEDKEHIADDYEQHNGEYLLKSEIPAPLPPTDEEQRQNRANAYAQEVDPLHSQKMRHVILGDWTEEDEANYVAEIKRLSEEINNRFPYMENIEINQLENKE